MFKLLNLSVLAYANSFTMWHYRHNGDCVDIAQHNFFIGADDLLKKGDLILVNCADGNTSVWVTKSEPELVEVKENLLPCIIT